MVYLNFEKMRPTPWLTEHCRKPQPCIYYNVYAGYCDYMAIEGHHRPCKPGDACTVKLTSRDGLEKSKKINPWSNQPDRPERRKGPKGRLDGNPQAEVLYNKGLNDTEMADALQCSKYCVYSWRKRTNRAPNHTADMGRPKKKKQEEV